MRAPWGYPSEFLVGKCWSDLANVIEKIFMLSVVIQALKKSVMFLCTPFANRCWIYSDLAFEITLHSTSARQDSPCADSPDHRSVRNKEAYMNILSLWGRDFVSVVHIRESLFYRGFFLKKILNENFFGTLETVRNGEVSVRRGSTLSSKIHTCFQTWLI